MRTTLDLRAVVALTVLCGSWGLNQTAIKVALAGMPPAFQMGSRSLVAAILVYLWCRIRRRPMFDADGTLVPGLTAGLMFAVEFLCIFWGLQLTTASRGVVFMYTAPFVVALGGHFLLGEPLTARKLVGLCAAFVGIAAAFSDALALPSRETILGDLLCIAGAFLWGATTILIKRSALNQAAAEKTLLYQLGVSAPVGLAVSYVIGERVVPTAALAVWPAFAYQAVWVAAITYVAWFALMRDYPASLLSSFTFLTPLFGVAAGAVLLGEPLTPALLVALALVATGIYLVNRSPSPSQASLVPK